MDKKDYEEPRCPMDNSAWVKKKVTPISADRVISKEDEYLAKNDYAGAERHLLYWWREAENGNDDRGMLLLCNELMGLKRKLGQGEAAKEYAVRALGLVKELGLEDTVSGATAFLNSGTVYKAFGEPEKSLEYFEKAKSVYESLGADDGRLAGLYNNMALTLADLRRFSEARKLYMAAIAKVSGISPADEAITWLNIADCSMNEKGPEESAEEVSSCLDRAETLLDSVPSEKRDGYYAFVCEKCAPAFDYHGRFLTAEKYRTLAAEIYALNK